MQVNLKKLRPVGVVMVLLIGVLTVVAYFTADFGVPERYIPAHDSEYYAQSEGHMRELLAELEENVFPRLDGISKYEISGKAIIIWIDSEYYDRMKAVILRDFDEPLFTFHMEQH